MRTCRYLAGERAVLKEGSTDTLYEKAEFEKTVQQFWLPREVNVSWDFPDCVYGDRHRYSAYRLVSVDSDRKITSLKTT
jgi:hypothetical protein